MKKTELFPDGTPIDNWFFEMPAVSEAKRYNITDYGIKDDGEIYTKQIQTLIDTIASEGGGDLVVPKGTYHTGALFFKQNVNLLIEENGVLMGSDDISDYSLCYTRIEGENCLYFPALINANGIDAPYRVAVVFQFGLVGDSKFLRDCAAVRVIRKC